MCIRRHSLVEGGYWNSERLCNLKIGCYGNMIKMLKTVNVAYINICTVILFGHKAFEEYK